MTNMETMKPNRTETKKVAVRKEDKSLVVFATCRALLGAHGPMTTKHLHYVVDRLEEKNGGMNPKLIQRAVYYLRRLGQAVKAEERAWELTDAGFEAVG